MKLSDLSIEVLGRGCFGIRARVEDGNIEDLEALKGKTIRADLKEWKERRSLNANAYFHVLAHEIARTVGISDEEAKSSLVKEYGALKRNADGSTCGLMIPNPQRPENLGVKYAKWFDVRLIDGKLMDCYLVYEETHNLDTSQMAKLIDGAVTTAKSLGIETMTPEELRSLFDGN